MCRISQLEEQKWILEFFNPSILDPSLPSGPTEAAATQTWKLGGGGSGLPASC